MRPHQPPAAAVVEGTAAELRATFAIALPLAGAQVAQVMMGFTSASMMGHLGSAALAAGGLGAGLSFMIVLIFQGILASVGPLAAHAIGAGEERGVGPIVGHGLLIAAALSLIGIAAITQVHHLLEAVGQAPELVAAIRRYLGAALWGVPGALGYSVLRSYLAAMSRTVPLMVVLVLCLGLNVVVSSALIYGSFGAPALGIAGAGYANATVQWVQFGALALYLALRRSGHGIFRAVLRPRRAEALRLLRLGLPIAGIYALEAGIFSTTGVLAGLFGSAALAAHQVTVGFGSIAFMVPLAFSHAATVRVALTKGAGRIDAARRAGAVALACGAIFMAGVAAFMMLAPGLVIGLYLDRADPANAPALPIARRLIFIAAVFQIFDGAQAVAAGALRGLRDAAVPMLIAGIGYWGIGFGSGLLLGFGLGLGVDGLWWGLAIGLAAVAVPLALRFRRLTAASAAA